MLVRSVQMNHPLCVDNPAIRPISPIFLFSENPTFDNIFRWCRPKDIRDKRKNKIMRESYFFVFRRLQHKIICFFVSNTFKQQQAKI